MNYETIRVRCQDEACSVQLYRPHAGNAFSQLMVEECTDLLSQHTGSVKIVVLEGLADVFCPGADLQEVGQEKQLDPESIYDLWLKLATGPFITIAHVQGKANAGGVGFVAASDIVIASAKAQFSLSELLFGLMPACVLPFLARRVGVQKANYMALMTNPVSAQQALSWGLVDAYEAESEVLLHRHLLRLSRISKDAVSRYKQYAGGLDRLLEEFRFPAVSANREVFSNDRNLEAIARYRDKGLLEL